MPKRSRSSTSPCKGLRSPFVPAKAGTQSFYKRICGAALGPRFRGDERSMIGTWSAP